MAENTNSESGDDADLDASEDHSLEMLGRVYSEAVTRRATESGEASPRGLTGDPLPSEADALADSAIDPFSDDACPVNPRTILEAMFFVGVQGSGLTARKAASLIRGVSPKEIEQLVDELNLSYSADHSALRIRQSGDGYRLVIEDDLESIRQLFYGRVRDARLGNAAIEVLAVVAYHQPVTLEEVDRLRNHQSGPVLNQLVRRELLTIERDQNNRRIRLYRTTQRFLELFGMDSIEDLPQAHSPQGADFLDE